MKTDGRVGEAACFGCGCWADDPQPGRYNIFHTLTP